MTDPALIPAIDAALAQVRPTALPWTRPDIQALVAVLTRCRATIAEHEGAWFDFPPPLASDGPCRAGWTDREGDAQEAKSDEWYHGTFTYSIMAIDADGNPVQVSKEATP